MNGMILRRCSSCVILALLATTAIASPLGTSFTYQGQLNMGGAPLNNAADFEFTLWDADTLGSPIGSTIAVNNVAVVDGLFAFELDFGAMAFNGDARWLEIAVASPSGGAFTTLTPRQAITAAPYALQTRGIVVGANNSVVHIPALNAADGPGAVVSGGTNNSAPNIRSTVAGGLNNIASSDYSTVSGGRNNTASGNHSVVSGGQNNSTAGGVSATIGGGENNSASGYYATVPGGRNNTASGDDSFAAGSYARAAHLGSFVWSDGTTAPSQFASTDEWQFLINATGGVGIGTATPGTALDVVGTVRATAFVGDGSGLTNVQGTWTPNGADISYTSGNVGIGTTNPQSSLDVGGDVAADSVITPSVLSNDGTGLKLQSTNLTLDQSFESTCCYGVGPDVWQSFTAGVTGDLGAVELHRFDGAAAATVQIYAGEGTGGALLASTSIPATGDYVWQRATMPAAIPVVSANVYTIRLVASGASNWVYQDEMNLYAGGRWSISAGGDFGFRTHVVGGSPTATVHDKGLGVGRVAVTNALEVEGNASKSAAGDWLANSDRRIKTNIETVTGALDTLDKVRLVSFEYTDDYKASHAGVGDERYLNVIAQEFAEVFPDHVKGSGEYLPDGSEILQVDTYPLTIYSAAAIQELRAEKNAEIESLRAAHAAEIKALNDRNAELETRLARIEVMLTSNRKGTR